MGSNRVLGPFWRTAFYWAAYTLGPALRIPDIKNLGKELAPEELRICPEFTGGPAREAKKMRF